MKLFEVLKPKEVDMLFKGMLLVYILSCFAFMAAGFILAEALTTEDCYNFILNLKRESVFNCLDINETADMNRIAREVYGE